MDPMMFLLNTQSPFVSATFAQRLALLVIEEKYPRNVFTAQWPGKVVDQEDTWKVTFENTVAQPDEQGLAMSGGQLVPWRLTIEIRKSNAEIVSIR